MKIINYLILLILFFLALDLSAQVKKQTSDGLWYLEYMDPACANGGCPAAVFLIGSGERGPADGSQLYKVQNQGTPKLLKQAGKTYLPGFVFFAPQQTTNYYGWIGNQAVTKFFKFVRANYKIDGRLFATGLSMGGDGCWEGSYHSSGYDSLVTAFVPVSSLDNDYNGGKVTAGYHTPVWAIHGSNDSPDKGLKAINGMNTQNPNPAPLWTLIQGGGHNSFTWDIAFSLTPRAELGNTTIYEWMLKQGKPVTPPVEEKDPVVKSYYFEGKLNFETESGQVYKVVPEK